MLGLRDALAEALVVEARDPHGKQVELILLSGGISDDPAARDRFVAAAEARFRADPEAVLGASPVGTRSWVAVPPGTAHRVVDDLVAAAQPATATVGGQGPRFDPYWRDRQPGIGWQPGLAYWSDEPTSRPWWRFWWLVALFLLIMIALLLLFSQCAPPPPDLNPSSGSGSGGQTRSNSAPDSSGSGSPTSSGQSSQTPTSGSQSSGSGSPTSSSQGSQSPSSGPSGAPSQPGGTGTVITPTNKA